MRQSYVALFHRLQIQVRDEYFESLKGKLETIREHNLKLRAELEQSDSLLEALERTIFHMRKCIPSDDAKEKGNMDSVGGF